MSRRGGADSSGAELRQTNPAEASIRVTRPIEENWLAGRKCARLSGAAPLNMQMRLEESKLELDIESNTSIGEWHIEKQQKDNWRLTKSHACRW